MKKRKITIKSKPRAFQDSKFFHEEDGGSWNLICIDVVEAILETEVQIGDSIVVTVANYPAPGTKSYVYRRALYDDCGDVIIKQKSYPLVSDHTELLEQKLKIKPNEPLYLKIELVKAPWTIQNQTTKKCLGLV